MFEPGGFLVRLQGPGLHVAGVLSGTSADGIDVALSRFRADAQGHLLPPQLVAFATAAFAPDLARRLRAVLDGEPLGLRETALLDRDLGRTFGRAAVELASQHGFVLELVGSHGQTVYHHDGSEPSGPASLQLGDGDFLAEETGCSVVSDFRQRDLAAGGEGAPISALADDLLFARLPRPGGVLNLGGIANLTIFDAEGALARSFDTGPAGSLLDGLARRTLGCECDQNGACAARGRVRPELVDAWMSHSFFDRPPPKSTGRDTFGAAWVESCLSGACAGGFWRPGSDPADLFASAVELVARAVGQGLERWVPERLAALSIAGGGVHNLALCAALQRHVRCPCSSSALHGVDPDAREGLVFAVLAVRCVLGQPVSSPLATGAQTGRVLGKISRGPLPADGCRRPAGG